MADAEDLRKRLDDAESALAGLLGSARGTTLRGQDSPEGRAYDRLCEIIEREATRIMPYLAETF